MIQDILIYVWFGNNCHFIILVAVALSTTLDIHSQKYTEQNKIDFHYINLVFSEFYI